MLVRENKVKGVASSPLALPACWKSQWPSKTSAQKGHRISRSSPKNVCVNCLHLLLWIDDPGRSSYNTGYVSPIWSIISEQMSVIIYFIIQYSETHSKK